MYCDQRNSVFYRLGHVWDFGRLVLHNYTTSKSCSWSWKFAQDLINQVCCAEEYFRTFLDLMTVLVSEMKTDADYKVGRMA